MRWSIDSSAIGKIQHGGLLGPTLALEGPAGVSTQWGEPISTSARRVVLFGRTNNHDTLGSETSRRGTAEVAIRCGESIRHRPNVLLSGVADRNSPGQNEMKLPVECEFRHDDSSPSLSTLNLRSDSTPLTPFAKTNSYVTLMFALDRGSFENK